MQCSKQRLRPHQRVPHSVRNHSNRRSLATRVHLQTPITRFKTVTAPLAAADLAFQETVAPAEAEAAGPQQHPLFAWVRQNNGYVHPALTIVDNAPCGCRGVIAVADVSMPAQQQHGAPESPAAAQRSFAAGQQQLPLLAVPEQLYMTTDDALDILGAAITQHLQQQSQNNASSAGAGGLQKLLERFHPLSLGQQQQQQLVESLQRLQPALLLALLLAYERSKGPESYWYPYIASLPEEPPCGWFTALQQQQQQQQQQQPPTGTTPDDVAAAAAAVVSKCSAAAAMYGPALDACFSADDVVWAYGQVVSRAFGNGRDVAFAPLIDMLNHQLSSGQPQLITLPGEAAAAAAGSAAAGSATGVALETLLAAAAGALTCDTGLLPPEDHDQAQQSSLSLWCVCKAPQEHQQQQQQQQQQHQHQQQQLVLAAGEELYISYVTRCDASAAYLNFGFVPPERAGQQ